MTSLRVLSAAEIVDALALQPNRRGGWFRPSPSVGPNDGGPVPAVVTYLLSLAEPMCSAHRLPVDAMYCFHHGCPVVVLAESPDGRTEQVVLGSDIGAGQQLQVVVPAGWPTGFALRGGPWALLSEAVAADPHDESTTRPAMPARGRAARREDHAIRGAITLEPGGPVAIADLQQVLALEPNLEGGFYRQTFESADLVDTPTGLRPRMNSIFYLLTEASPLGALHRNRSDIAHFHHVGGSSTYLLASPDGEATEVVLGRDYLAGEVPTFTAPGGCWKTSRIAPETGGDCLISEVVVPGFRYEDHAMADVDSFGGAYPELIDRFRLYIADGSAE